jgi:hypothetical protein
VNQAGGQIARPSFIAGAVSAQWFVVRLLKSLLHLRNEVNPGSDFESSLQVIEEIAGVQARTIRFKQNKE